MSISRPNPLLGERLPTEPSWVSVSLLLLGERLPTEPSPPLDLVLGECLLTEPWLLHRSVGRPSLSGQTLLGERLLTEPWLLRRAVGRPSLSIQTLLGERLLTEPFDSAARSGDLHQRGIR